MWRLPRMMLATAFLAVTCLVGSAGTAVADVPDSVESFVEDVFNHPGFGAGQGVDSGGEDFDQYMYDRCLSGGTSVEQCGQILLPDNQRPAVGPEQLLTMIAPSATKVIGKDGVDASSKWLRKFAGRCTGRATCVSLGLRGLSGLVGGWWEDGDTLDLFEDDSAAPEVNEGSSLLDSLRAEPNPAGNMAKPCATVKPVEVGRAENGTLQITFEAFRSCWAYEYREPGQAGYVARTDATSNSDLHCRNADGDVRTMVENISVAWSWYGDGEPPAADQTTTVTYSSCGPGWEPEYFGMRARSYHSQRGGPVDLWSAGAKARPASEDTFGMTVKCRTRPGVIESITSIGQPGEHTIPIPKCNEEGQFIGVEVGPLDGEGGVIPETVYDFGPSTLGTVSPKRYEDSDCQGTSCTYRVKVGTNQSASSSDCTQGQAGCIRWLDNPTSQCWYGGTIVDKRLCGPLERYYEVERDSTKATDKNTDGDPRTWDGPDPEPDIPTTGGVGGGGNDSGGSTAPRCKSATYNLGPVQPAAVRLADVVGPKFGFETIGGYRESDPYPDHPSGRALDLMTYSDKAMGDAAAEWLRSNAAKYDIDYVIWYQKIWSVDRASEGWRAMEDRGSATANHKDHIHVVVYPTSGDLDCGAGGTSGDGGECFEDGWSWNPINWVLEPVKCALSWAFIPDPIKTDISIAKIRTAWLTHPPGSIISRLQPAIESLGVGLTSGDCSDLPSITPMGSEPVQLPCEPAHGQPWDGLYLVGQAAIVSATAWHLWGMAAAAVSARSTGVDA